MKKGKPRPPAHLGKRASLVWAAYSRRLENPSRYELEQLEAFCVEKARWLEAVEYLDKEGVTVLVRSERGEVKAVLEAPQVKIAERSRHALLQLASALSFRDDE